MPHLPEYLNNEFKRTVKNSDIYVEEHLTSLSKPELEAKLEIRREMSFGLFPLNRMRSTGMFKEYTVAVARILYGSGITWLFELSPISKEENDLARLLDHMAFESFYESNLKGCLGNLYESFELQVNQSLLRDKKLSNQLISIQEKNPEKEILTTRGSNHTPLWHYLQKTGINHNVVFPEKPYVYAYHNEVERRFIFGKEVDDLMVLKNLVDVLILSYYWKFKSRPYRTSAYRSRMKVERMKKGEIERLSEAISKKWLPKRKKKRSYFAFQRLIGKTLEL